MWRTQEKKDDRQTNKNRIGGSAEAGEYGADWNKQQT
jgi:hypothetical protein